MKRPETAEVLLTPVMDLLSLLTIGFLTIGILAAMLRTGIPNARQRDVAMQTAARVAAEAEANRHAAEDAKGVVELEGKLRDRTARLAQLAELLAAPSEPRHGFSSGAPIVRPSRVAESTYVVILTNGRVVPIEKPYVLAERTSTGGVAVRPARAGLTVEEAFRPDASLARVIAAAAFRQTGRVVLLVTADSFGTFRAVRERLTREGVDFGWEPVLDGAIEFGEGPNSRQVYSQSPTP